MDGGHNKGIERPLYVSFFKGLAFGIFAIILKIAVSFSTWQKYVSNGSLGELENFAIYIICFVASLFVYNSVIGISMTYDPISRDELLMSTYDKKGAIPSFRGIFFYKSFLAESLGITLTVALGALFGASPEIFGMFYFDEGRSPFSSGILPFLITVPLIFLFCAWERFEAVRYWKLLYRTASLEVIESKPRIIFKILFILIFYPLCLPFIPFIAYIAVFLFGIITALAEALTVPGLIGIVLLILIAFWWLKVFTAIMKRKKFIGRLRTQAESLNYTISEINNPYASFLSTRKKCTFSVTYKNKKYDCIMIGNPRYRVPVCFISETDGYFRHRLGTKKHNITLQTKFNYSLEGDGKKILIISPVAKDAFILDGDKERRIFNADRLWDFVAYEPEAFIAALERDCLGRYD